MLDFRQLMALRGVAEHRSIARAARALGWSQPSIAHHLKGLEGVLGSPVVASNSSGTYLTIAGTCLLPHAIAILDRAERAVAEVVDTTTTEKRNISLGVFPSAAARLLPAVVHSLWEANYSLQVREAELSALVSGIDSMALDAAIVYSDPRSRTAPPLGIHVHPLFTERFFLIVPVGHPFAERKDVTLDEFTNENWILGASPNDPCDAALLTAATELRFTPRVAIRSDDYAVIARYVEAGFGIALVPELALPAHVDSVSVLTLRDRTLMREISLMTSEHLEVETVRILSESAQAARPTALEI